MSAVDLVTGGTGFIGQHLVRRLLATGRRVRVLCRSGSEAKLPAALRSQVEVVHGDLLDCDSLLRAAHGAERVFHCAGHVSDWGTEADFRLSNVQGTRWLLEAAQKAQVRRFLHFSSIAAFGTPSPRYFDDDSPHGDGFDAYSKTKAEGEQVVFDFHRDTGLAVTVLRPAVVYGVGGTWMEEPLKLIQQGKMFLLAGGNGTCHPCFIENLLDAALLAADHPAAVGRGYIVADDDPISFREFFDTLAWIAGRGPIERSIPLPLAKALAAGCELFARTTRSKARPLLTQAAIAMVTTRSELSMRRIKEELGFHPQYSFRSAAQTLREWYQQERSGTPRLSGVSAG